MTQLPLPNTAALAPLFPAIPFDPAPYVDADDKRKHAYVIECLAMETRRPVAEIEPLYEDILAHLRAVARIQDYLPILVSKRVKKVLRN